MIQFFPSKTCIVDRLDIFVVTYRVTNFLPKLVDMLWKKTEFPFFVFPYFRVLPGRTDKTRFPTPHKQSCSV